MHLCWREELPNSCIILADSSTPIPVRYLCLLRTIPPPFADSPFQRQKFRSILCSFIFYTSGSQHADRIVIWIWRHFQWLVADCRVNCFQSQKVLVSHLLHCTSPHLAKKFHGYSVIWARSWATALVIGPVNSTALKIMLPTLGFEIFAFGLWCSWTTWPSENLLPAGSRCDPCSSARYCK